MLLAVHPRPTLADSPAPPRSYAKTSQNGQYLFVMRLPNWSESDEGRKIRETYPSSGLYRNDGSREAIWEVDWYTFDVEVCNDGIHLVRKGGSAQNFSDEAFSFF